jgi:hypothetical protein
MGPHTPSTSIIHCKVRTMMYSDQDPFFTFKGPVGSERFNPHPAWVMEIEVSHTPKARVIGRRSHVVGLGRKRPALYKQEGLAWFGSLPRWKQFLSRER